ncbi:MAG: DUF3472 domain-containing protein [Verrucomicrobiota bacterium]
MLHKLLLFCAALAVLPAGAEITVPAATVYGIPHTLPLRLDDEDGVRRWPDPALKLKWFGEFKQAGELQAALEVKLPKDAKSELQMTIDGKSAKASVTGTGEAQAVKFGGFTLAKAGYAAIELESLNPKGMDAGNIRSLTLDGPATEGAHFNLKPRRNAASVHMNYPVESKPEVAVFYNEVTAVEDPEHTFYMACGFSRGYFGMQVNSPTERRIIFSVWDSGSGKNAKDRSTVDPANQTRLLAKGEGVDAGVFGNEGTGGHSHLTYSWKTGEAQKFALTAKPEGQTTVYSGFWFHPEKKAWMLIASFQAPHDGGHIQRMHSFCENFGGESGCLQRKALYGPQWIRTAQGDWRELTKATFSHDATGKADRLDRFMGVESGKFFLSNGGFVEGFTKFGDPFTRPAESKAPEIALPEIKP